MNVVKFFKETRQEVQKVTWPTRRETTMTTGLIVAMALAAGVFFLIVDQSLSFAISKLLGMRG
ncbi:MAG: preprotein translocase subunit SecE [Bdellovibrionales bacterium]